MKQIVLTPQPILFQKAKKVDFFDAKLNIIIQEMTSALLSAQNPKGVGLAGPQIGYPLRIFAMKPTDNAKISFYINPEIIAISHKDTEMTQTNTPLEGCLSIPNAWGTVIRKNAITIKYQNLKGKILSKAFAGFPAVIVQHEMDHLDGILFTGRVLEQNGKLYEIIKDKQGKEKLKELPL